MVFLALQFFSCFYVKLYAHGLVVLFSILCFGLDSCLFTCQSHFKLFENDMPLGEFLSFVMCVQTMIVINTNIIVHDKEVGPLYSYIPKKISDH
jgi:hypothetical protein